MLIAYFSYRRYYRPLKHARCEVPYPRQADRASAKIAIQGGDLEQHMTGEFSLDDLSEDEAEAYPLTEAHSARSSTEQNDAEPP